MSNQSIEQKLEYLDETKQMIGEAIVNKGQTISEETPFRDYVQKILDIETGESTNSLNVFIQEEEPEIKDGIWIQGDKTFDSVKVTDIVSSDPYWEGYNTSALPFTLSGDCSRVQYQDWVYLYPDGYSYGYKYNLIGGSYKQITNPYLAESSKYFYVSLACVYEDNIYLFGRDKLMYKFNINTEEFTALNNMPFSITSTSLEPVLVDDVIYIFYTNGYKYNISNDSWQTLSSRPSTLESGTAAKLIGDKIYILGGTSWSNRGAAACYIHEYDIATDTYTRLGSLGNGYTHYFQDGQSSAIVLGTDIYYFGSGDGNSSSAKNKCGIYHTTTKTQTTLTDIPYYFEPGAVAYYNNKFYLLGGSGTSTYIGTMILPSIEFENNSIIIQDGNIYKTQFTTLPNINGRLETSFKDVYHYTDTNGLDGTLPTYYGNGTEWVKFKN